MKTPRCQWLSILLAAGASGSFAAEQPDSLSHSIPAPPMGVKKNADLGRAVAMDGNYLVAADPGADPAVINVFNPVTGALLFVLPNPSTTAGDGFGSSLAISGTRVVVGAPNDDTGASDAGSAYVYDLSSVTPMAPVATLHNPGPATDERFGYAVAVSGARVVVGAFRENTGAAWAGSAYVFDLTSATPTVPVVTLNDPDAEYSDYFGWSVAIFGTRVAVGAPGDDNHGANAAGSVYVYELSGGTPTVPVITWSNPSAAPSDGFGFSVALSDTRLIVGTNGDDEPGENAGSVSVYNLGSGTPTIPEATLSRPTPSQRFFGHRVAISGTRVVVLADGTGKSAYMYDLGGGTPTIPAATLDIPGNRVAWSAAIVGTRVAVGAQTDDAGAAVGGGRVYLYDTGTATPGAPITALPGATPVVPAERFGSSIGISGSLVVIGAFEDDAVPGVANAGNAYVYDLVSASPTVQP